MVLGIDTGGTYTDGVLLDTGSRRVQASYKSLTTRRDLSIGIEKVIEGIAINDPAAVKLVSISTTLATNAIAEGKGKQVGLLLIGYDPELIATFRLGRRFATPHYHFFPGGHDIHGREKEALDLRAVLAKANALQDQVDAIAISGYFSPFNSDHERRAFEALSATCDLPIVLGHQLSTKLGSVERATTAAINASLLAVLQEFFVAVRRALARRQIDAPLMIVRGDGTLMSDEFAVRAPVETIHSGPAASAIGGRFLSGLEDALVIDIGGTTTDIALLQGGQVTVNEEGATVGDYKTTVKAANILTLGLGGDSHIRIDRGENLVIGPERVVPLSYLAWQHPEVRDRLRALRWRPGKSPARPESLEFWFLLREPGTKDYENDPLKSERERALIELLRDGPLPVPEILTRLDLLHVAQIRASDLQRREIVGKSGLTPTDLLHVEGRFAPWDAEAAGLALEAQSVFLSEDPAAVRQQVWSQMTGAIVLAIVTLLSGRRLPPDPLPGDKDLGPWFLHNSLYHNHPYLDTTIRLRLPIIGIGAPANIFLEGIAQAMHTELILPDHYQVANAVGAAAGNVVESAEALIYPQLSREGMEVIGYYVQARDDVRRFPELDEARAYAHQVSRKGALDAAIRSGADNPQVVMAEKIDGLDTYRIVAKAMGKPRLGK